MLKGVAFPTTEIGTDPRDISAFARGVEGLGYDYLTCIDHVIQAREPAADDWRAYYARANPFHEVLVLFGFLAAVTERLGLTTAILIAPQRPTVLIAKQLAQIDVLSGGRLRAGLGIGWSEMEYAALGQDFSRRGRRLEEQMRVLRQLWCEETSSFTGEWDRFEDAGINPLPVQRPIPLWVGAFVPAAIRRAGRLADGLLLNPRVRPGAQATTEIELFRDAAREVGRDVATLGLDVTLLTEGRAAAELAEEAECWLAHGATHLTVRTMTAGYRSVAEHLGALERARRALPD